MNLTMLIVFLVFAIMIGWHSYEVWTKPSAFVGRMKNMRSKLYNSSFGVFITKSMNDNLDENPDFEIWLARLGFSILYVFILYGLYVSITGKH
jgi:hypothetical protein